MEFPIQLIADLRRAARVAVLTGAGISKESGIPTFREAQTGLWAQYDPTELATAQAFARNPKLVWEWYEWRRGLVGAAEPNEGHRALVMLEEKVLHFTLITQNVDGMHRRAGSRNVIELHGNIRRTKCFNEDEVVESWMDGDSVPPLCPRCGGLLRPDVVWFGENLPPGVIDAAFEQAERAEVFLSVGTSALVQPAASLPLYAKRAGALLVEINPDRTPLTSQADYHLAGAAGEVLPALVQEI